MRLVVLASGSGTNLQAIIDACAAGTLDAEIVLIVTNRQQAYALERARLAGIPTLYFPLKPYRDQGLDRAMYDADLATRINEYEPDLIVLAGWMHVLSAAFIDHFPQGIINLHPALPGTIPGVDAIKRAYEAYQRGEITHSGCMIHYVIPEIDAGKVVQQRVVPFEVGDTLAAFEARMHAAEHELIVEAIQLIAKERATS